MSELEVRDIQLAMELEEEFKKIMKARRRETLVAWGTSMGVSLAEGAETAGGEQGEQLERAGEHSVTCMRTFDKL